MTRRPGPIVLLVTDKQNCAVREQGRRVYVSTAIRHEAGKTEIVGAGVEELGFCAGKNRPPDSRQ